MSEVTFEQVTQLADQLPAHEQRKLIAYLTRRLAAPTTNRQPESLYGIWKGYFPEDLDIEAEIREIRDEWKKDLEDEPQ